MGDIAFTVAHKLIQYQQKYPEKLDLIGLAIKEGSADFIGELISGKSWLEEMTGAFLRLPDPSTAPHVSQTVRESQRVRNAVAT
jgi:hypothetical protein